MLSSMTEEVMFGRLPGRCQLMWFKRLKSDSSQVSPILKDGF